MFNAVFNIWQPKKLAGNASIDNHERNLLIGISYLNIILNVIYLFINIKMNIPLWPTVIQIAGSIAVLISLKLFITYIIGAYILLTLIILAFVGMIIFFHEFPYTILIWTPLIPVVSVYLLGKKGGTVWTIGAAVIVSATTIYSEFSAFNGYKIPDNETFKVAAMTVIMAMMTCLWASILFVNYIKRLNDELNKSNKKLRQQNKVIEENVEEKRILVSVICHDILNPLQIIMGYGQMMKIKPHLLKVEIFEKIDKAANIIFQIIESVRSFEALNSKKMAIELGEIDLRVIFAKAKFVFSERLSKKSLKLKYEYDENDDLLVIAEESSLSNSVFNNLISNAIKFSEPNNEIIVRVQNLAGGIELSITDSGIGMSDILVSNLFDKNVPTTRRGTSGETGSGFGMLIAKAYMEKYGGAITVSSQEKRGDQAGHGTTFILKFKKAKKDRETIDLKKENLELNS